jgi:hypothetical protein
MVKNSFRAIVIVLFGSMAVYGTTVAPAAAAFDAYIGFDDSTAPDAGFEIEDYSFHDAMTVAPTSEHGHISVAMRKARGQGG